MQKLLVAALLLSLVAVIYGQEPGPERCGIFGDCICRPFCDLNLEREGLWTDCSNPGEVCCCANETCGIFDDCSCRSSCESDERESIIDECETGGTTCCCEN